MEGGLIPWAGVCTSCRRAIQSQEADGPWLDDDGRSECVNTTSRHDPELPVAYANVTADDWVTTERRR